LGGKVKVSARKIFEALDEREYIEISVKDTGRGIPDKRLKYLFNLEMAHSTEGTQKEKGSGLGLILCKEFVEKNGGQIKVTSVEGKGSVFVFTIPTKSIL
jgi:signal transduction histidine kinase